MATSKPGLPSGITVYRGKYRVRIFFDGRQVAIGTFDALKDAKAALTLAQCRRPRETARRRPRCCPVAVMRTAH